jgi:hypothetical protein
VQKLGRYHLARGDGRIVAAAPRLQIFFQLFQGFVDAFDVRFYDAFILPDKRG